MIISKKVSKLNQKSNFISIIHFMVNIKYIIIIYLGLLKTEVNKFGMQNKLKTLYETNHDTFTVQTKPHGSIAVKIIITLNLFNFENIKFLLLCIS